jgi:hypothetical protein
VISFSELLSSFFAMRDQMAMASCSKWAFRMDEMAFFGDGSAGGRAPEPVSRVAR